MWTLKIEKELYSVSEENKCDQCRKMDELEEGQDICPKIWSCKIYAKPGKEYKHFKPRVTATAAR
jgi:hypothetical protein